MTVLTNKLHRQMVITNVRNFRYVRKNYSARTVARKFSIGGFCGSAGGLDIIKLTETPLIYSVSRFSLGGLSSPKPPRGDGTVFSHSKIVKLYMYVAASNSLMD